MAQAAEGHRAKRKRPWAAAVPYVPQRSTRMGRLLRDLMRFVLLAFLLLSIVRIFIADAFVIYTGSMEPTIRGRMEGGDRILLSKLYYQLLDPERFDIAAFRYSNNLDSRYMKRLIGVSNEQLFIRNGDIYVGDPHFGGTLAEGLANARITILKKPRILQDDLFERFVVLSERDFILQSAESLHTFFEIPNPASGQSEGHGTSISVRCDTEFLITHRGDVRDFQPDLPIDPKAKTGLGFAGGKNRVGDLSIRVRCNAAHEGTTLILAIDDPHVEGSLRAELRIENDRALARLFRGDRPITPDTPAPRFIAGSVLRLDNADDRLSFRVGNDFELARDYTHKPTEKDDEKAEARATASFGLRSGNASLEFLSLHRDLYYIREGQDRFLIPEDHYVFLGDNSAGSSDSRGWKRNAVEFVSDGTIGLGDKDGVTSRHHMLHDGNPWKEADGTHSFVDILGNLRTITSNEHFKNLATYATPYVSKKEIFGRGLFRVSPLTRSGPLR